MRRVWKGVGVRSSYFCWQTKGRCFLSAFRSSTTHTVQKPRVSRSAKKQKNLNGHDAMRQPHTMHKQKIRLVAAPGRAKAAPFRLDSESSLRSEDESLASACGRLLRLLRRSEHTYHTGEPYTNGRVQRKNVVFEWWIMIFTGTRPMTSKL